MKAHFALTPLIALIFSLPIRADDPAPLPADLKAVPTDALGFVHIRVADVWKSEAFKEVRETLLRAGTKAIEGFDTRFVPHPSSIDRLTIVFLPQDPELKKEPLFYAILATNKAIEKEDFLKSALPGAVKKELKFGHYYSDEKSKIGVSFITDQIIAFGPPQALEAYYSQNARADGALGSALQMASGRRHIVAAVNTSMIAAKLRAEAPPQVTPLLKAKLFTLAVDVAGDAHLDASLTFADEKQTSDAETALKSLAAQGRAGLKKLHMEMLNKVLGDGKIAPLQELPEAAGSLFALGALERIDDFLADPPIKKRDNTLQASLKFSTVSGVTGNFAIGMGLLLPAVQKVREAAARTQSSNNLKQIGLAMLNYESAYGHFPPAAICDKNGKPLLSWRVAILPYIEQQNLYNAFKLDEPWDSEHNKPLANTIVKVYTSPAAPNTTLGLTHYRIFYGNGALFELNKGVRIQDITDGTSNTFMVGEAEQAAPWTQPDDFAYDPKKPLPKFASFTNGGFNALFADGSVRFMSNSTPEKTIRAYITRNGGEVVGEGDELPRSVPAKSAPPARK